LLARMGDLLDLHWTAQAVDPERHRGAQMASQSRALSAKGMVLPDGRHLRELAHLVELGQITAIEEWAYRLQAAQAECAPLAAQVLEAARSLDLQGLEALLADMTQSAAPRL